MDELEARLRSRVHRTLRELPRLRKSWEALPPLEAGESAIAVYENNDPRRSVIITTRGLRSLDGYLTLPYGSIDTVFVDTTPADKRTATRLVLRLFDGSDQVLSIDGGEGPFRDVFAFQRFVMRVIEDLKDLGTT